MVTVMREPSSRDRIGRVLRSAVLVALTTVLLACGSDDDSSPAKADDVARVAYVAEVNALCQRVTDESESRNRRLQALLDAEGPYRDRLVKGAPLIRENYDAQRSKLDRFRRIAPPDADRSEVAGVIEAAELTVRRLGEALPPADRGDLKSFLDTMTEAAGALAYVDYLGTTYGFDRDCFTIPVTFRASGPPGSTAERARALLEKAGSPSATGQPAGG